MSSAWPSLSIATVSFMLLTGGSGKSAEVHVDGQPQAVHVEVRDASLQEVLAALQDCFNLRYRSNDALATLKTGVFNGSLAHVAARILDGYDYAMTITPEGIDVLVLGQAGASPTAATVTPASAPRPPLTTAERKHFEHEHLR
jgi:hypothetical protein